MAALPSNAAGANQCGRAPRCDTSQLRRWSSSARFCASTNAPAATQKPTVSSTCVSSVPSVDVHTKNTERGRGGRERGVAPEREPVGDAWPSPTPRAPPAGWRRRWRAPGRARCAGGASRPRAGSRSRARCRTPGSPMVVVDGSSASTTYTASPTTARAAPTHTDQPRHRTSAPSAWGSERGAHHGEHEAARVDDPSERQRGHHAQRRERERRHEAGAPDHHGACTGRRAERACGTTSRSTRSRTGSSTRRRRPPSACGANAAGCVSTTTTPMPASAPSARSVSGATRPSTAIDEVDAPVRAQVLEHRRQLVASRRADGGEHVDDVVTGIAAGAQHLAGARDELDPSPEPRQSRADRCGGLDRDLERRRVVARRGARRARPRRGTATALRPGGS